MKFAVVLVTYNRLECLKIALKRYENQILPPSHIFVINNASTDGTEEFLQQWAMEKNAPFEKEVINTQSNLGGAGGFALGIQKASQSECDFLFLADDDAYAEESALFELSNAYTNSRNKEKISALCTAIMRFGKLDITQRAHIKKTGLKVKFYATTEEEYCTEIFRVDVLSFVGGAIKREVVSKIGLPAKEYFIHFDDVEYSMRIAQVGDIYCVPASVMNHDTDETVKITWKNYYSLRNEILTIKSHYPRRYFYTAVLMAYIKRGSLLARLLKKRTPAQVKMYRAAISDAIHGFLGMHALYRPGVDIESIQ